MEGKSGIADVFLGFRWAILLDAINKLKGSYRGSGWNSNRKVSARLCPTWRSSLLYFVRLDGTYRKATR